MTRKHFKAIAADISMVRDRLNDERKNGRTLAPDQVLDALASELARTLHGFNANFNQGRFLAACGVSDSPAAVVGEYGGMTGTMLTHHKATWAR
ncbi:MAG: hypothetical protein ABSB42_07955 [Tepidisphaeraceae bacterium]